MKLIFFLFEDFGIWAFGSNGLGQLGFGRYSNKIQTRPKRVEFFDKMKIKQISCGSDHTIVLTGKIWYFYKF